MTMQWVDVSNNSWGASVTRAGALARVVSWLVWAVLVCLVAGQAAQAQTYTFRNDAYSYDTPPAGLNVVTWHTGTTGSTNGAPTCTSYPLGDDDWADIVFANATTPVNTFSFTFAGTAYTSLRLYSNGMLVFGNDTSGRWRTFSNATLPYGAVLGTYATGCPGGVLSRAIIPYWTDIVAGTGNSTAGAAVQYELLGTAPNRRLVISWVNVKLYNQAARYNFQVALYESPAGGLNSNFKFQYSSGSSTGAAATVGVQVSTTDSTLYSFNQAFIDPAIGSAILWYPANQLAARAAEYRFDESLWNGTAGEVKDTSGSAQHGVRVGTTSNVPNTKVCRGASIPLNTSNAVLDAIATPITPGNVGSIDFWFNSTLRWASADAMLFDATLTAARPFFLMKSATGVLKFSVTDGAGTVLTLSSAAQGFALNTWHHIGVSWNLRPGTNQTVLQIYLDGVLLTRLRTTSNGAITALSTLDLGDNATSGVTPSGGSPNSANGLLDEINFYPTEINLAQVVADLNATHVCKAMDHFHVIHGGTALTCAFTPVTVEAHAADHSLVALSGATLGLSTSLNHGNWINVAGGAINTITNSGNGVGSYVFSNESSVTFGLQNPAAAAESLTIGAVSGAVTNNSGTASACVAADYTSGSTCNTPLSFALAGFIFANTVTGSSYVLPAQVAGIPTGSLYLRAVQAATSNPALCTPAIANQTTAVTMGYTCNNPSSCQAGSLATLNSTAIASAGTAVTLTFDANASAPLTVRYDDAGQITLNASKSITPPGGTAVTLNGSSNAFVVAPHHFGFSGISAGPIKAGVNFSAQVSAFNGLASATVTRNFGQETTPEGVSLTRTKYQPTGTNAIDGSWALPVVSAFAAGAASATLSWGEVGRIDLTATLASGSYLGSSLTATGSTGVTGGVGPFTPHHFDTVVTPGCGAAFTYSAQAFTTKVTARNLAGVKTSNYDGGGVNPTPAFAKNVTLSATGATGTLTNAVIAANLFSLGEATLTQLPTFSFSTQPSPPASIVVRATDTDGVSSSGYTEGSHLIRSGRLRLGNAMGPDTRDLKMVIEAQFWNGSNFARNTDDSCTVVPASAWSFGNYARRPASTVFNPVASTTTLAGGSAFMMVPRPTGGRVTFDASINLATTGAETATSACLRNLSLVTPTRPWAPVVANTAPSPVRPSLTHLLGAWCDTTAVNNPSARGSFGLYRGADSSIFQRENY